MKPTIIHIIPSLARGGAETLLIGVVNALPQYRHHIISLQKKNEFPELSPDVEVTHLNLKGYASLPRLVRQVSAILKSYKGKTVVHAHLFWAHIVSRLAAPKGMPVFNSYHSVAYGKEGAHYPLHALMLDRFSYRKDVQTICVSKAVQQNVTRYIHIRENINIFYNFIEDTFFQESKKIYQAGNTLRLVSVGNLKEAKNYGLTLDALHLIQQEHPSVLCTLDIYGAGPLEKELKNKVQSFGLKGVHFCGAVPKIAEKLPQYDAYLISSSNEGFGLAVVEAMASGLPVLASDLPVLREVTAGHALFFKPQDPATLAEHIKSIFDGMVNLSSLAKKGSERALYFRKNNYMHCLDSLYQKALNAS